MISCASPLSQASVTSISSTVLPAPSTKFSASHRSMSKKLWQPCAQIGRARAGPALTPGREARCREASLGSRFFLLQHLLRIVIQDFSIFSALYSQLPSGGDQPPAAKTERIAHVGENQVLRAGQPQFRQGRRVHDSSGRFAEANQDLQQRISHHVPAQA